MYTQGGHDTGRRRSLHPSLPATKLALGCPVCLGTPCLVLFSPVGRPPLSHVRLSQCTSIRCRCAGCRLTDARHSGVLDGSLRGLPWLALACGQTGQTGPASTVASTRILSSPHILSASSTTVAAAATARRRRQWIGYIGRGPKIGETEGRILGTRAHTHFQGLWVCNNLLRPPPPPQAQPHLTQLATRARTVTSTLEARLWSSMVCATPGARLVYPACPIRTPPGTHH